MMLLRLIIFCVVFLIIHVDSYKILTVLPTPFKSHWMIGSAIAKELAKVGHEVTFVSPSELKFKNVKNVVLERHKSGLIRISKYFKDQRINKQVF